MGGWRGHATYSVSVCPGWPSCPACPKRPSTGSASSPVARSLAQACPRLVRLGPRSALAPASGLHCGLPVGGGNGDHSCRHLCPAGHGFFNGPDHRPGAGGECHGKPGGIAFWPSSRPAWSQAQPGLEPRALDTDGSGGCLLNHRARLLACGQPCRACHGRLAKRGARGRGGLVRA